NGFSPGSESSPGDSLQQQFGVGRLRFSLADATASPNVLDAPGTVTMVNRITLRDPNEGTFMTSASSFSVDSAFMFVTPDVNSFYGIRVSDSTGVGSAFNDQLDLRVTNNGAGVAFLNLRRVTSAGGLDVVNTPLGAAAIGSFLMAGKTMADVVAIAFEMSYVPGAGNGVRAGAELIDATGAGIGLYDFFAESGGTIYPQIFHGEGFTHASAGANWTVTSVPEPETWALMLGGLAALGAAARRRRPG
ncbi:MAG TPA: PEPxxWA-CTERM sorting domain-containing protein, partial [Caldimonas sp.]|nr:PEPxxWA-CTERM sorting domain-containing protein [Caldimonas sp.]